jgi:hypothetical protein
MTAILEKPTANAMKDAYNRFDKENRIIEDALGELFRQFPKNNETAHVLLKVTTLNDLYSTQIPLYSKRIPTVWQVVDHIVALRIDSALDLGSSDLVYNVARIEIPNDKVHYNYSFATKYCNWHRPDFYPIYDSCVDEYLWHLMNQGLIDRFERQSLKVYPSLKAVVTKLRDRYGLAEFDFKQIDKYLYMKGAELLASKGARKKFAAKENLRVDGPEADATTECAPPTFDR